MIHLLNLTKNYHYPIEDDKPYLYISITIGDDRKPDGSSMFGQIIQIDDCERLDIMIDANATRDSIADALQSLADGIRLSSKKNTLAE